MKSCSLLSNSYLEVMSRHLDRRVDVHPAVYITQLLLYCGKEEIHNEIKS